MLNLFCVERNWTVVDATAVAEVLLIKSWRRIFGRYKSARLSINAIEVPFVRRERGQLGNIYSPSFPTSWATMLSPATAHRTSNASLSSRTSQFSFDWNQTTNRLPSVLQRSIVLRSRGRVADRSDLAVATLPWLERETVLSFWDKTESVRSKFIDVRSKDRSYCQRQPSEVKARNSHSDLSRE